MILTRTVIVPEPDARANVLDALCGAGAPSGIISCTVDDAIIVLTFDSERTAPEVVDALVEIETAFVPTRVATLVDPVAAANIAARGLHDPELNASRIIETYLS